MRFRAPIARNYLWVATLRDGSIMPALERCDKEVIHWRLFSAHRCSDIVITPKFSPFPDSGVKMRH